MNRFVVVLVLTISTAGTQPPIVVAIGHPSQNHEGRVNLQCWNLGHQLQNHKKSQICWSFKVPFGTLNGQICWSFKVPNGTLNTHTVFLAFPCFFVLMFGFLVGSHLDQDVCSYATLGVYDTDSSPEGWTDQSKWAHPQGRERHQKGDAEGIAKTHGCEKSPDATRASRASVRAAHSSTTCYREKVQTLNLSDPSSLDVLIVLSVCLFNF